MKTNNASLAHYRFEQDRMIIFGSHAHSIRPAPVFDMHLPIEVGVVLSGKMGRYNGAVYTELPRGGIWFTSMLEPHGRNALVENTLVAVFIISTEFFFHTIIPGVDNSFWQTPFNTPAEKRPLLIDEEFALIVERLIRIIKNETNQTVIATQTNLSFLDFMLHMNRIGGFESEQHHSKLTDFEQLRQAFELIYRSQRPIGTDEAAKICKLSTSRFSQLFTKVTGLSYSKFSLRFRLSQVEYALRVDNASLDELAERWGFTDKSHLVHRFKEHYNATPQNYRQNHTDLYKKV